MTYRCDDTDIGGYLVSARSLAEYRAMFGLSDADLRGRILDCPGGAASFTAEAAELGVEAIAVDPVYRSPAHQLSGRILDEADRGTDWVGAHTTNYVWSFYGDPAAHNHMRRHAAQRFAQDLASNADRYVAGALPVLDFQDDSFDLVLSSHLLFTYANRLDDDFHLAATTELVRVCRGEVRIYPLLDQAGARLDHMVERLRVGLAGRSIRSELRPTLYEFQRGAKDMLVLGKQARTTT